MYNLTRRLLAAEKRQYRVNCLKLLIMQASLSNRAGGTENALTPGPKVNPGEGGRHSSLAPGAQFPFLLDRSQVKVQLPINKCKPIVFIQHSDLRYVTSQARSSRRWS